MLPSDFADLEPFAQQWCLGSEPERYEMRLATPMPEIIKRTSRKAPSSTLVSLPAPRMKCVSVRAEW